MKNKNNKTSEIDGSHPIESGDTLRSRRRLPKDRPVRRVISLGGDDDDESGGKTETAGRSKPTAAKERRSNNLTRPGQREHLLKAAWRLQQLLEVFAGNRGRHDLLELSNALADLADDPFTAELGPIAKYVWSCVQNMEVIEEANFELEEKLRILRLLLVRRI